MSHISQSKRILIILLSGGLGDVLLSTSVLKPLKNSYKDSRITMMVKDGIQNILSFNNLIDDFFPVPDGDLNGGNFDIWLDKIKLAKFDIALVLWSTSKTAHLVNKAKIPIRVGQGSRLFYSYLYTHKVGIRSEKGDTQSHWTDIMLDYVRALNVPVEKADIKLEIPTEIIEKMKERLISTAESLDLKPPFWGFHAGKGMELDAERWPVIFFAELADRIIEKFGGTIVFTGNKKEEDLVKAIQSKMKQNALNFTGKTSLKELAGLLLSFNAFIAPDTGPGHLSAILGVPTISLFALKSDFPNRWKPFGGKVEIVLNEQNKCNLKCIKEKCRFFDCYNYINKEEIINKIEKLL